MMCRAVYSLEQVKNHVIANFRNRSWKKGNGKLADSSGQKALDRLLIHLAEKGKTKMASDLLDEGANANARDFIGRTVLIRATMSARNETIEMLLKREADVNAKDGEGWTALMWAKYLNYSHTARLLRKYGAEE